MIKNLRLFTGLILLALLLTVGVAGAADVPQADLNVTKMVSSAGPYAVNDTITWVVTVWNNGPDDATDVVLKEDISELSGHGDITVDVSAGTYDSATENWTIPLLENATSASLTLATNFSTPGEKINSISITDQAPGDLLQEDNSAESGVVIYDKLLLSADLKIKPTTLNLNSKGVFTVYVTLNVPQSGEEKAAKPRIDFASSSLTCSEAELIRASVSNKDGGTLIAKFYRQDLQNVTNGTGVMVNCSGTLSVDGESIYVEGSDTIRVMGEKKGVDKILSQLWKFLGIEKDEIEINESEDGNVTVLFTLNPDNFKNPGQVKKFLKNQDDQDNESDTEILNETAVSKQARNREENQVKNNGNNQQIRQNTADNNTDRGANGSNKNKDESSGKANGKKTK
jgi:hypothetical protein